MIAEVSVTILLALLAGAITLVSPLVTRSNLVSGFRQSWINDQRNDLATIAAKATLLSSNTSSDWSKDMEAFVISASRVRLRQNPDKAEEWDGVITSIEDLRKKLWRNKGSWCDVTPELESIQSSSQRPLKDNWNKTRGGETQHLAALIVAAVIIVLAVLALAWSAATSRGEKKDTTNAPSSVVVIAGCPIAPTLIDQAGTTVLRCPPPAASNLAPRETPPGKTRPSQ